MSCCWAMGSATGMNCSLPSATDNGDAWQAGVCLVYDAVLHAVGNGTLPRLNCTFSVANGVDYGVHGPHVPCNWTMPHFDGRGPQPV